MLSNQFSRFLRDERGSYTVWSLVWFILYVAIGGLAVDMTDAYRNQTLLQSTADAAALAGAMSLPDQDDAVAQALNYAADNMGQNPHGIVLTAEDVFIGTWDFASETFTANTADPNAVYVITRRAEQNANPLALNFLRILALFGFNPQWDINTDAVAVQGVNVCHNNGIIAEGEFSVTTHIDFLREICLIGHEKFWFNPHTTFDDGVYVGAGCSAGDTQCIGPGGTQQFANEGFRNAFGLDDYGGGHYGDKTPASNADNVDDYINAVLDLGENYATFDEFLLDYSIPNTGIDYGGYEYLADPDTGEVDFYSGSSLPETLSQYTVYEINCNPSGYDLPGGDYVNMAIIAHCPIRLSAPGGESYNISNSMIGSTHTGGNHAIHASGNVDLGAPECGEGGAELYALGRVHFAASGNISNTRILSQDDITYAANPTGPVGIHIETTGDFSTAAGPGDGGEGQLGLCEDDLKKWPQVLTVSLVR